MPELAEVETVRRVLKEKLIGKKIKKVDVFYEDMIKTDITSFKNNLIGEEFIDIKRFGKWLVFELNNYFLVCHLRMEGKFYYSADFKNNPHEHVVLTLDNNYYLRYKDVRKFGVMYLVLKDKLFIDTPLSKLGFEPFDNKLTANYLIDKLHSKKQAIKTSLLDQEIISGLGNIYVDEVLFKSNISPFKHSNLITLAEADKIINNSKSILTEAIKCGGTTIRSYTSSLGVTGHYQDKLLVHTKTICSICNSKIIVKKINGRSTYYCPKCQGVLDE